MSTATEEPLTREIDEKVYIPSLIDAGKTKDLGDGIVEAVVTTGNVDRQNEKIVTDGIDVSPYLASPIVLYGHDYESLPIGKTISLKQSKNKMTAKFQFAIDEYPFAKTVYNLVKGGYLNDVSIGGIVKKWSEDYSTIEQMEMIEFSVVNIGANRDAKIIARSLDMDVKELKEQYEDFVRRSMVDKVKHMGDDEIEQSIKVMKNLIGVLEESATTQSSEGDAEPQQVKRIKRIRMLDTAKSVHRESERIIRTIKLKAKE